MTFIQSIILGIIQGITEFLPISSSAHLVLIPYLLNWSIPQEQLFPFDVLVQMGTLAAVIFYYREDLFIILKAMLNGLIKHTPFAEVEARTGWLTILATIPAGLVGLLAKPVIESTFSNPFATAIFLFVTALFLAASEFLGKRTREIDTLTWKDALWIGIFQALSVFPGISRSGSTITGGMTRNLKRRTAGQYAFLMAVPIMLAAGAMGVLDLRDVPNLRNFLPVMTSGFLVSAIVGYYSISWLIRYINNHSLLPFAGYCLLLGAGSLALLTFNPQTSTANLTSSVETNAGAAYQVGIDPELEWLLPSMNKCQQDFPKQEFLYQQFPNNTGAAGNFDVFFTYRLPADRTGSTFQIGDDHLVVVVNASSTMQQVSPALINAVFSGRTTTWQSAYEACQECFSSDNSTSNQAITLWALPEDSNLWGEFNSAYLSAPLSSFANIAPNSKSMRQMIAADTNAIGILPSGWLNDSVKSIPINTENDPALFLPITATTQSVPDANLGLWLNCIQTTFQ
jgi:undecaprenyl-diphosphatase